MEQTGWTWQQVQESPARVLSEFAAWKSGRVKAANQRADRK